MKAYHEQSQTMRKIAADARSGFASIQGEKNDHQEALDYINSVDETIKETLL
jgi:hypothetical protein